MSSHRLDATIPGQFPSQDGIDRSNHIAFVFSLNVEWTPEEFESIDWQRINDLEPDYVAWVELSIKEWQREKETPDWGIDLDRKHYQVGPAAGGLFDTVEQIVTAYNVASDIYGRIDFALFLLYLARKAREKARKWADEQDIDGLDVGQVYTPFVLKYMCIGYVMDEFGDEPIGEVSIFCLTTNFYDGISSPAHPTSMLDYQVDVPTVSGIYRFEVKGDGAVTRLTLGSDSESTDLLHTPNLHESREDTA